LRMEGLRKGQVSAVATIGVRGSRAFETAERDAAGSGESQKGEGE
jgi:hypothetical protein